MRFHKNPLTSKRAAGNYKQILENTKREKEFLFHLNNNVVLDALSDYIKDNRKISLINDYYKIYAIANKWPDEHLTEWKAEKLYMHIKEVNNIDNDKSIAYYKRIEKDYRRAGWPRSTKKAIKSQLLGLLK